jgi:hypothetical protein
MQSNSKPFAAILLLSLLLCVDSVFAKRGAAKPVPPIIYKGITYSAPNNGALINWVLASDPTGGELFRIKVFDMPIDPRLEEDAQWVFITGLRLSGGSLLVEDEKGRCYAVDLDTRAVKRKYWCRF